MLARQPEDAPPADVPRNSDEERESELRAEVESRLDPAGRVALAALIGHLHAGIDQRETMLREELRIEEEKCLTCKHRKA